MTMPRGTTSFATADRMRSSLAKDPTGAGSATKTGSAHTTEWSVIPFSKSPETFVWPDMTGGTWEAARNSRPGSYLVWDPAEVNVPILNGWFWSQEAAKTAAELVEIFYQGLAATESLINLSPDNRGLIPDNQLASLRLMSQVVSETFAKNLAAGGTLRLTRPIGQGPSLAMDGNLDTWWEAAPGKTTAALTVKLPAPSRSMWYRCRKRWTIAAGASSRSPSKPRTAADWAACPWIRGEETTTVGHKRLLGLRRL